MEKVEILRLTYRGGKATPRLVKCLQGPCGHVEHTYGGRWFWEPCRSVEHTYAPANSRNNTKRSANVPKIIK